MQAIYKYEINIGADTTIEMPIGAVVLSAHEQNDRVFVWAIVDTTTNAKTKRHFKVFGTGHPIERWNRMRYIGTAFCAGGALVWHVFEEQLP
jgi:hypothetical protein